MKWQTHGYTSDHVLLGRGHYASDKQTTSREACLPLMPYYFICWFWSSAELLPSQVNILESVVKRLSDSKNQHLDSSKLCLFFHATSFASRSQERCLELKKNLSMAIQPRKRNNLIATQIVNALDCICSHTSFPLLLIKVLVPVSLFLCLSVQLCMFL